MSWLGQGMGGSVMSLAAYNRPAPPQQPPPQPQLPPSPYGNDPALRDPVVMGGRDTHLRRVGYNNHMVNGGMNPRGIGGAFANAQATANAGFGQYENSINRGVGAKMVSHAARADTSTDRHGVAAQGPASLGPNAVEAARMQGPSEAQIRADMERRKVGASLGPRNAALAGYMMG